MNSLTQKNCSVCGASFGCGAKISGADSEGNAGGSCWCEDSPRAEIVDGLDCRCPSCLGRIVQQQKLTPQDATKFPAQLIEGVDYYLEGNALVFTALYHLRRGYCCDSGCRHCPYSKASDSVESGAQK